MRGEVWGVTLVVLGLGLATGPSLAFRLADALQSEARETEVERWIADEMPADGEPQPAPVLEPGADGYLLEIPKLGLRAIVHELEPEVFLGRNTPRLREHGLGQVPYTVNLRNVSPGAEGTAAISGHRTTRGAPFRNIHQLGQGDVIVLRKGALEQRWEVVYSTTVVPSQVDAIRSRPGTRRLAILACNPPFSARERLVVYARLIEGGGG